MPQKTLQFSNPRVLNQLYCGKESNLARIEESLDLSLVARDDWLQVTGETPSIERVEFLFKILQDARQQGINVRQPDFENLLKSVINGEDEALLGLFTDPIVIQVNRKTIVPKTLGQKSYLQAIRKSDVTFGIGPAGTGKTYLAMAAAVEALLRDDVKRIILSRPAVEAGEALGFLPGDLREKILPYLRPIYDAMYDMMNRDDANLLIDKGTIEIAPLAYMRGRTLSNAFIVLDEAQNTTPEQMMMFLTRLGEGSRIVVTGDITQIDLPRSKTSGLKQAARILADVEGVSFHYFGASDVVRHPLVQRIIEAYERHTDARETHDHA